MNPFLGLNPFDIVKQFTGGGEEVVEEGIEVTQAPSITDRVFSRAQKREQFTDIDMQGEDSVTNLNWMADTIGKIESNNNPESINKQDNSSARGEWQWLTNPKKGQPAFITGVNRAINQYEDSDEEVPSWLYKAKEHGDPTLLDRDQQKDIFFADIFERTGSDALIKRIIENKDVDALRELYLDKWHTAPTPATIKRVDKILGINKSGGGSLMGRNPDNNYNTQRMI